jgi:hypothetical protein
MHANIPIDNLKDFEGEFLEILFLEAANTRAKMKDKILNGKLLQKYVDTFKNGRKDSKAWIEAADFLEEHFDEKNIVTIDL